MQAATPVGSWHDRPAVVMAGLGLVSGLLSAWWFTLDYQPQFLRPVADLFLLDTGPMPIGVFFALVIAVAMTRWARPSWAAVIGFLVTMYAWSFAVHTAIRLQRNRDDDPHLFAAGLCAGALGAGLTHLGVALFVRELRAPARIALTCAVGAVAGLLLYLGQRKVIDERLLFVIWQPAVAFCIGRGLGAGVRAD
jgi:hypothetical protein